MKIKIAIKHSLTDTVLFEFNEEKNTLKDTILEAIKQDADLRSADLSYADLHSAKNLNSDSTNYWWQHTS